MDGIIGRLHKIIGELQDEIEREIEEKRREFKYKLEKGRVIFEKEILAEHRSLKQSVLQFLRESRILRVVTAPVIYSVSVPLIFIDIGMTLYQWICFPVYGIPYVRRKDYFVFDRQYLAYLNAIQKFNCVYCEYANGLIAYIREIVSRTEQFWCPIKHARKVKDPHKRYYDFIEYGDGKDLKRKWEDQRQQCRACKEPCGE